MSVFVDPLMSHGWCIRGKYIQSCHLCSDQPGLGGIDELIEFGLRIGLKTSWLQGRRTPGRVPHFDLTRGKRAWAIEAGAKPVSCVEAVAIWRGLRPPCSSDPPLVAGERKQKGELMARYWWRFLVKDEDGDECYLGDGCSYSDPGDPLIGTEEEADAEADRRVEAWEKRTGGWACRVTLERRGQVKGD